MRWLLVTAAFALLLGACGSESGGVTPEEGIALQRIDFSTSEVVIRNLGDTDYDLTGHALCNRPNYLSLPSQALAPGESITIDASSLQLSSGGGEVGLYTAGDFGNPDAIVGYVQWGSDSHGRTDTAVAAGVWSAGDFVAGGASALVSNADRPVDASDWSAG